MIYRRVVSGVLTLSFLWTRYYHVTPFVTAPGGSYMRSSKDKLATKRRAKALRRALAFCVSSPGILGMDVWHSYWIAVRGPDVDCVRFRGVKGCSAMGRGV